MAYADSASEDRGEGVEETKGSDVEDGRCVTLVAANSSGSTSFTAETANPILNEFHVDIDDEEDNDANEVDGANFRKGNGIFKRQYKTAGSYLRKKGLMVAERKEAEIPPGTDFELVSEDWRKFLWFKDPEVC